MKTRSWSGVRLEGSRAALWGAALLCGVPALLFRTAAAQAQATPVAELAIFKAWLDRQHPGYGRDEGPGQFQTATVEAA